MAERVELTAEQTEALQKLRAKHNDSLSSEETHWVSIDATGPAKVLILPGTAGDP
jgi:hypothetical protein